jgi:hypothetical protein
MRNFLLNNSLSRYFSKPTYFYPAKKEIIFVASLKNDVHEAMCFIISPAARFCDGTNKLTITGESKGY